MDTKKVEISPTFRKMFPDEAARAEQYSIPIGAKGGKRVLGYPVFYGMYRVQLTGYLADKDGPLKPTDVPRVVKAQMDKIVAAIERERRSTDRERFTRIVDMLRKSDEHASLGMILEAHSYGADVGSCFRGTVQVRVNGRMYEGRGHSREEALANVMEKFEEAQNVSKIDA